jgi:hypothetical protein
VDPRGFANARPAADDMVGGAMFRKISRALFDVTPWVANLIYAKQWSTGQGAHPH